MIDRDTILHLANLARMKVTNEEADSLKGDLERILEYVGALKDVDTKGISREGEIGTLKNVWRDDVHVPQGDATPLIVSEAPEHEGGYVKVPKILADF